MLTPLLDKKLSSGGRYWLWLLVMIGLCLPLFSFIPRPALQIDIPVPYEKPMVVSSEYQSNGLPLIENELPSNGVEKITEEYTPSTPEPQTQPEPSFVLPTLDPLHMILAVWLAGILISLLYYIIVHLTFTRFVRRWSYTVNDQDILAVLDAERNALDIRGAVRLLHCKGINGPMLTGFLHPAILLPEESYDTEELWLIFRHELIHHKRCDLWYKLALAAVRSIHWFNPAVYLMTAQANLDLEAIVDTLTVHGLDIEQRRQYSEIILSMATGPNVCRSRLTTSFTGGKSMLKKRLENILGSAKKSGAAAFVIAGIVIFTAGLLVGFNFAPASQEPLQASTQSLQPAVSAPPMTSSPAPVLTADIPTPSASPSIIPAATPAPSLVPSVTVGSFEELAEAERDALLDLIDEMVRLKPTIEGSANNIYERYWAGESYTDLKELQALVFDEPKLREEKLTDITELILNPGWDNVKVTRGGSELTLRYYEWLEGEYMPQIEDKKLTLTQSIPYYKTKSTLSNNWFSNYLLSKGKNYVNTVEVIIPVNMPLELLQINAGSGKVTVQDGGISDRLVINAGSGKIELLGGEYAGRGISLNAGSGMVSIQDCVFSRNLSLNVGSGMAEAINCKLGGSTSVNAGSGDIFIDGCTFDNLRLSAGSGGGTVKLNDSVKNYNVQVNTVNGGLLYNGQPVDKKSLNNTSATSRLTLSGASGTFRIDDKN